MTVTTSFAGQFAPARQRATTRYQQVRRWLAPSLAVTAFIALNVLVLAVEPILFRVSMYDQRYSAARIADYYDAPHPDIIFMGASRTLLGFDPELSERIIEEPTGRDVQALNLGLAGGGIDVSYLLLKNIITDDKKPSVIVYGLVETELNALIPHSYTVFPYVDIIMRPDDMEFYAGESWQKRLGFLVKQACLLCRDRDLIRDSLSIAFNPDDPAHKFYVPGPSHLPPGPKGFRRMPDGARAPESAQQSNITQMRALLKGFQVGGPRLTLLADFITLANRRGIKVVLVNMPVEPAVREMWDSEASLQGYLDVVRNTARERHAELLDLYRDSEIWMPAGSFIDVHHLNGTGATALTQRVTEEVLVDIFRR